MIYALRQIGLSHSKEEARRGFRPFISPAPDGSCAATEYLHAQVNALFREMGAAAGEDVTYADLKALLLTHPKHMRRDTALCAAFRSQGAITSHARKLRDLAAEKLGMQIQAGEHSPVEDAIAALRLSKLACAKWDAISVKKPIKLIKGGLKKPKKKVGHRRPYKPGQPPRTA